MLTAQGRDWLASLMAADLIGCKLVISDGDQRAEAEATVHVEGGVVHLTANFTAEVANFEWSKRSVLRADGTEVDIKDEDLGRKVEGAIWALEALIEV